MDSHRNDNALTRAGLKGIDKLPESARKALESLPEHDLKVLARAQNAVDAGGPENDIGHGFF